MLEIRSLQKKYIAVFLCIGFFISCFLCFAKNVTIITKPSISQIAGASLIIAKDSTETRISSESVNIFQLQFPVGFTRPLIAQDSRSGLLTSKIAISDISITNVFGGTIKFHHLKTTTRILDFINTSHFFDVSLNSTPVHQLSTPLLIGYFLSLGIVFAGCGILLLFFTDNLFNLLCLIWLKLINRQKNDKCQSVIIYTIFAIVILLSIAMCYVGILHADDGFFNLMAKYPTDVLSGLPSTYYTITHLILVAVGENLILFRLVTVVLSFLSVMAVSCSLFNFMASTLKLNCNAKSQYAIFILLIIVNSFQYLHHLTPDYNNLSRVTVYLQIAILLILFSKINLPSRYSWCWILGVITGINYFVKAPEALASSLVIMILFWWVEKSYLKKLSFFLLGLTASVLCYFLFIQSWQDWFKVLHYSMYYSNLLGGHQAGSLLLQNFRDIVYFIGQSILFLGFYRWLIIPLINKYPRKYIVLLIIFIISLITVIYLFYLPRKFDLFLFFAPVGKLFLFIFLLVLYENILAYSKFDNLGKLQFKYIGLTSLLLLVFTYIASVGTDTPIFYHIIFHPCLIIMAIILQWWLFDDNNDSRMLVVFILIISSSLIFIKASFYNSAMYTNLLQQTVRYNIAGESVYISNGANSGLKNLKAQLYACGYQDGDYISGYYIMPDIIFALGGRSPVTPWYSNSNENVKTFKANQYLYSLLPNSARKKLFILIAEDQNPASTGIDFGRDFTYCGAVNFESYNDFRIKYIKVFRRLD